MHFGYVIDGYRRHFEKHPLQERPKMARVHDKAPHELLPGEYGKWAKTGDWYGVPPGTELTANLARHQVTEHADGTITVDPLILVGDGKKSWHGCLVRGEWKEC